jgi:adenine-specific DNA-methyltransferase
MIELLDGRPYEKHYLDDSEDAVYSILPFYSRHGTEDLKRLGIGGLFDTPKPVAMIEMLVLAMASGRKELKVLDFFAGSGTTGQAVWQAQAKLGDSCNLSFDLVQIDEKMRKSTKPYSVASSLGIEPRIPCATKYRLDRFAALNGIEDGYEYVPC